MMDRAAIASPKRTARIAGVFYAGTIVTGALALRGGLTFTLIATACYVAVTLLFYGLFAPVGRKLSLLAAVIGIAGCAVGAIDALKLAPIEINSLVFFGFYCLLIGYLVFRSTFLPGVLGVLMAIGGLGWLTFLIPSFAKSLAPYNLFPGILGEGVLTFWLLAFGVNVERWRERAGAGP